MILPRTFSTVAESEGGDGEIQLRESVQSRDNNADFGFILLIN
ncbi:MAG: hypothetical protein ACOC04_06370 [Halothece sp.]